MIMNDTIRLKTRFDTDRALRQAIVDNVSINYNGLGNLDSAIMNILTHQAL